MIKKLPSTFVLLSCVLLTAYISTWIIPSGGYQTETTESGTEVVIPGSFELLEEDIDLPPWAVLTAIPRGMSKVEGVLFFVLILGGGLSVIRATGTVDAFVYMITRVFGDRPRLLIFLLLLGFAVGASTYGMAEETIPMVGIIAFICRKIRADALTTVAIITIGTGVGYGAAAINPFTIVVAQNISDLPPLSGIEFRLAIFVPFFLLGYFYVWHKAKKAIDANTGAIETDMPEAQADADFEKVTWQHTSIIVLCVFAFVLLVWGCIRHDWYTTEMSGLFLGLTLFSGFIAGQKFDEMIAKFSQGVAELAELVLIIGIAVATEVVLRDAKVLHTIVHYMSGPMTFLGSEGSAVLMLLIQSAVNVFIPGGSSQAFIAMPIMAPLSDVAGVSRQVAVLAFQMGDGFTNMVIPTSVILLSVLKLAGVSFGQWFRYVWPYYLMTLGLAILVILVAVMIGYQ
jgi:uncharacterized ion transporter superfamily protein YfcC